MLLKFLRANFDFGFAIREQNVVNYLSNLSLRVELSTQ